MDVRELPLSRKKGFSKAALAANVESLGIRYIHLRELGAPREVRHALRDNGDWSSYRQSYLHVLRERNEALEKIVKLANTHRVCLMCFEEDYRVCHRSLITESIQHTGLVKKVKHLHLKKEKVVVV
ncbi:MAG: DUF488 domain-containing protein [Thermaceae bacterium]|nr:DUF488 domain-containing protein [Thermaceae bacterium]